MRRISSACRFLALFLAVVSHGALASAAWAPKVVVGTHYPRLAQLARIQDTVVVDVVIDAAGKPTRVGAVSGHPLLRDAVVASVKLWVFEKSGGEEKERTTRLTFVFRIGDEVCKNQCCEDKFVFSYPDRIEVIASTLPIMPNKSDTTSH